MTEKYTVLKGKMGVNGSKTGNKCTLRGDRNVRTLEGT